MEKKIIGIFVMTLLIATVLPAIGTVNIDQNTPVEKNITGDEGIISEVGQSRMLTDDFDWQIIGNNVVTGHGGSYPSGNVGIGTTSPLYSLTVKGNIASFPGDNSGLVFAGYSNGGGQITTQTSDGFFNNIFIKWGQTRFQGKVGIGEAHTPSAYLHVIAGPAGDTAIQGRSSGWAGYFEGKSYFSDNVGIGTNNPNYKLDVFDGNGIVAQFSGRVKGAEAVNDDEFATKKQVKAVVRDQLQSLLQLLYSPLARSFINQNIKDQCISNLFESLMKTRYTPTGTNDNNGNIGDITYDNSYIYIKTNEGWKRTSLETW